MPQASTRRSVPTRIPSDRDPSREAQDPGRRRLLAQSAALVATAGSGVLLTGCGGGDPAASGNDVTFLAVVPMTSLTFAPELLADSGGYFADVGLNVSFQSTRGSAQAIQLVMAGTAPLSRIGQIEAMNHIANRGAPLKNVSTILKQSTVRFISHTSNPMREPADFVGTTFGIPSEGGESEITLDLLLASAGLEPSAVERQVVGLGPGVFNLVEQGRISGFIVSIDTSIILQQQNSNAVVLHPNDFIDSGAQFYVVGDDYYASNMDIVQRYLTAIRRAVDFMIADDGFDETLSIMRTKHSFGTLADDAVAKASLAEYVGNWTAAGTGLLMRTDAARWQAGYEELVRNGRIEDGLDPSAWYTNELAPPA